MSLFTKIINREIPAEVIFEDDLCIVIKDIAPVAPFHALAIPKDPIVSLGATNSSHQSLLGHLLVICSEVAFKAGLNENGFRVVTNSGDWGGQTVPHLHFHIIGGKQLQPGIG